MTRTILARLAGRRAISARAIALALALSTAFAAAAPTSAPAQAHGPDEPQVYPPGAFRIGDYPFACGQAPVIVTPHIDGVGQASIGGPIVLHRDIEKFPLAFIGFVFAHECAHHLGEVSELRADTFAACLGKRQGWLTPAGLEEVCRITLPTRMTWMHLPGPLRCAGMIKAYRSC